MKLMELDSDQLQVEEKKENVVAFDAKEFHNLCSKIEGRQLDIKFSNDVLSFSFQEDDNSQRGILHYAFLKDIEAESYVKAMSIQKSYTKTYSLRLLKMISKLYNNSNTVEFRGSQQTPLTCSYDIYQFGNYTFYLAPYFDDNEDSFNDDCDIK